MLHVGNNFLPRLSSHDVHVLLHLYAPEMRSANEPFDRAMQILESLETAGEITFSSYTTCSTPYVDRCLFLPCIFHHDMHALLHLYSTPKMPSADKPPDRVMQVYAFSMENWQRNDAEISVLLRLFEQTLVDEADAMAQRGIRLLVAGSRDQLPGSLLNQISRWVTGTVVGRLKRHVTETLVEGLRECLPRLLLNQISRWGEMG